MPGPPVTVTVARRVAARPGDGVRGVGRPADRSGGRVRRFSGVGPVTPADPDDEWHVVYRFDSAATLAAWEASEHREAILRDAADLMETVAVQRVTGLETWFSLPGRVGEAPPKWKMFLVSGVVIYLLQVLEYTALGRYVDEWPLGLRVLTMSFPVTALMTWLVMPQASVLLRRWLFPVRSTAQ